MLKRILSVMLALTLAAAAVGCTGPAPSVPAENGGDQSGALPADNDAKYMNRPGESLPISLYSGSAKFIIDREYSPLYTDANNQFAATMLKAMDKNANCVVSPLSLEIALQLLANGGNEATRDALLASICPGLTREDVNASCARLIEKLLSTNGVTVSNAVVANSAFRLNTEFVNTAADYFRSSVGAIDFGDPEAALDRINSWVKEHTDGLIEKLLEDVGADTAIVILNALTLKLEWAKPFNALRELMTFNGAKGVEYAPVILSVNEFGYGEFDEGRMALIPYNGGEYAMAVVLPNEGVSPADAAAALMGRTGDCKPSCVSVKMPKVELSNRIDILGMADKLGIADGVRGSFPNMLDDGNAVVSQIVQGASLSVTEYGTVAAASTAVVATKGLPPEAQHEIVCDRPYAMFIYHIETGAVLFAATVCDVG